MLLVATKLAPSSIHGLGLFAAEPIRRGQLIWRFRSGFDVHVGSSEFIELPPAASAYLRHYGYRDQSGAWTMSGDNARFINHSDTPNTSTGPFLEDLRASRDIAAGEEITENYGEFATDDWRQAR